MTYNQYSLEENYSNLDTKKVLCHVCNRPHRVGFYIFDEYNNYYVGSVCGEECFNLWLLSET